MMHRVGREGKAGKGHQTRGHKPVVANQIQLLSLVVLFHHVHSFQSPAS